MDYEQRPVQLMAVISDQEDDLADKPGLEYFLVSLQFNELWFADHHGYYACEGDFKMRFLTNHRLAKTFVRWHNV